MRVKCFKILTELGRPCKRTLPDYFCQESLERGLSITKGFELKSFELIVTLGI